MFGTVRAGVVWGFGAVVVWALSLLAVVESGGASLLLGWLITFGLGCGAGLSAARTARAFSRQGAGRSITAGIIAGTIALFGTLIVGILIAAMYQRRLQTTVAWIPFRDRIPLLEDTVAFVLPYLQQGGVIGGACLGVGNLLLMTLGGGLGAIIWRR